MAVIAANHKALHNTKRDRSFNKCKKFDMFELQSYSLILHVMSSHLLLAVDIIWLCSTGGKVVAQTQRNDKGVC